MSRRHNLRLLKRNWPYLAGELAHTLSVNIVTIRRWTKQGLAPIERRSPFLFRGADVADFLAKRKKEHVSLKPGELFCVRCEQGRLPDRLQLGLVPRSPTSVDFTGRCSSCGLTMYRRVRSSEIMEKLGPCTLRSQDKQATVSCNRDPVQMSLFADIPK